jgi:tRNA threonylcarbamoyladenosine biosynthesis protein TsaB
VAIRSHAGAAVASAPVERSTHDRDMLMPAIDALVRSAGLSPRDLAMVAVSAGPGGFTGLRIAVATAKALALGLGAQVVAVPSGLVAAQTVASQEQLPDGWCGVALAAKGTSAWLERVLLRGGCAVGREAALRQEPRGALDALTALVCDAHLPQAWSEAARSAGVRVVPSWWSAVACLELGEAILKSQGPTDPLLLQPIYPRPPEAVTLWEARTGRAATGT